MKQTKRRSIRNPYDNARKISEISPWISASSSLTAEKGSIFKIQPRISIFLHNAELYIYTHKFRSKTRIWSRIRKNEIKQTQVVKLESDRSKQNWKSKMWNPSWNRNWNSDSLAFWISDRIRDNVGDTKTRAQGFSSECPHDLNPNFTTLKKKKIKLNFITVNIYIYIF